VKVLVTGAAGFIGGAVVAALRATDHEVVGVDAYIPQAHGDTPSVSEDIAHVDIRDQDGIRRLLRDVDVVCHQSAVVGAGVTPADLPLYATHNDFGTAVLLAAMAAANVEKLVLASSMVVYGEGLYACAEHGDRPAKPRTTVDLRSGCFDVGCPDCGEPMSWKLVDEESPLRPRSTYAASKVAQEHYATAWTRQTSGSVIALRYHNVYGPNMPADSPYSGVAAVFRSALANGVPPQVFEDGRQMRDFVHVADVALANLRAVDGVAKSNGESSAAYNICSGVPISISRVAQIVGQGADGVPLSAVVTGAFRPGDVRHIVGSPERARSELGFDALVTPAVGLQQFARDPLRRA
jgi:dTDP-L-rhamnose 4-epimerase